MQDFRDRTQIIVRTWLQTLFYAPTAAALLLAACGGGSGQSLTYNVGGTVSGLTGTVILQINGGSSLSVATNGTFTFPSAFQRGAAYAVTVQTQPSGQTCAVLHGSGTVGNANVSGITVTCAASTYTVGGTITGLGNESGLVLLNNSADATSIAANATAFTMTTALTSGTAYAITVQRHPPGVHCDVTNGAGTTNTSDVSNVSISCGLPLEQVLHTFGAAPPDGHSPQSGLLLASDGNYYGMTVNGGASGKGTVFKITPAGVQSTLYSFAGGPIDGANPYGELIQASDGALYGTASAGGASGFGAVFKITLAGTETTLHSFTGSPGDGNYPLAGLVQASDDNIYGTTQLGGAYGQGTAFKMTPAGSVSVLYSFGGSPDDGTIPGARLTVGSNLNFYGTTVGGGSSPSGGGTVFRMTSSGVVTILHSFLGEPTDGATPETHVIQASDGSFYGVTLNGGANNVGAIFKITPSGSETILHSFSGPPGDGKYPQGNLIEGSDGNFYGTTYLGGTEDRGTVFRITPAGVETLIYSFKGATASDGAWVWSGVIEAADGSLLGTTSGGGQNLGTVFKLY
jgi:uncharacterized repeat protein (TIGR03803 family)